MENEICGFKFLDQIFHIKKKFIACYYFFSTTWEIILIKTLICYSYSREVIILFGDSFKGNNNCVKYIKSVYVLEVYFM